MVAPPTALESAVMTSKFDLRKILRNERHEFVLKHNLSDIGSELAHAGPLLSCITRATSMACYHAVGGEPTVMSFAEFAHSHDVKSALPWLPPTEDKMEARTARIVFRQWACGDAVEKTALGFRQPSDDALTLTPDLILTPLVGFDRALNRLGQGAGHYDRAFEDLPNAIRVGVAWSAQQVDALPVDPWDIPLDAIITEREWITGPKSRIGK
jgi:5-formyltetrahydrofolate cyclo-ligase